MSLIPGDSGSPSYFPDGYNGSQLANIETISATRILTSSDRRIQILTPSGATRIVQLPGSTVLGEEWVFINPSTSSQSLTITSSNTATIVTIVPGSTVKVNALVASPSAPSDWVLNSLGNTVGPASATDNAIARFDGTTGKLVQNSDCTISDSGAVTLGPSGHTGAHTINGNSNSIVTTSGHNLIFKKSSGSSAMWQDDASVSGTANRAIDNNSGIMRFYNHGGVVDGTITQAGAWTLGPSSGTTTVSHIIKGYSSSSSPPALNSGVLNIENRQGQIPWIVLGAGGAKTGSWGSSTTYPFFASNSSGSDVVNIHGNGIYGYNPGTMRAVGVTSAQVLGDTTVSRRALKEDFRPLDWQGVLSLPVYKFKWKESGDEDIGCIADEVASLMPDFAYLNATTGEPEGVNYTKLSLAAIRAIQEQQAIIDGLKARLEALESGN